MLAEARSGMRTVGDGSTDALRLDRTGALVNVPGHARLQEPVRLGNVMIASTGVAGVAPGTAFSTTPPLVIWNPPSSGKNLVLISSTLAYVSGTLGAGFLAYGFNAAQTTVPTTGTELTPVNALIGFPRGVGRAFQGSTILAAPTILRAAYSMGPALATTAVFPFLLADSIDGEIIVPQGTLVAMQMVGGAGTTPLVVMSMSWEEVPA